MSGNAQDSRRRIAKVLAPRGGEPVEVPGVSARAELQHRPESGFAGLRHALQELLARHRGATITGRASQRILHAVQDAVAAIEVRLSANAMTPHQREAAVGSLELRLSEIRARSHEVRRCSDQTQNSLDEYVQELAADLHSKLLEALRLRSTPSRSTAMWISTPCWRPATRRWRCSTWRNSPAIFGRSTTSWSIG